MKRTWFGELARTLPALIGLAWCLIATGANAQLSATWTLSLAAGPAPRGWVDMLYDPVLRRTVLFAGSGSYYYNDIWSYDAAADQWTQVEPFVRPVTAFTPPCGRDENAFEYDAFNRLYWSFGGSGECGYLRSTAQAGTTASLIVDPSLTSTVRDFYKYWYVGVVAQNGMFYMSNVSSYDPQARTLALDVPIPALAPGVSYRLSAQGGGGTWSYDPSTARWASFDGPYWGYTGAKPVTRLDPAFAYSSVDRATVMFGGEIYNDTWVLDAETRTWLQMRSNGDSASPPATAEITNAMVYDSDHDVFVLFGGLCFETSRCAYRSVLADTWVYKLSSNTWTRMQPAQSPPARLQQQTAYDPVHHVAVMFGGVNGSVLDDLWMYSYQANTWARIPTPPVNPGARYLGTLAYDASTDQFVLYGGGNASFASAAEVWRLKLSGPNPTPTNQPPVAMINVSPASGTTATQFQFSGAGSYDPDGSVAGYFWDFGDEQTSSQASPTHRYAAAATYVARLTITDNQGAISQTSQAVSVTPATPTNQAPVAVIGISPASGTTATQFQFSGAGSYDPDGSVAGYFWDFGDEQTSSQASPTHRYAAAATYIAKLQITDNQGATSQTSQTVSVTPATSANQPPVALIAVSPTTGTMTTLFQFNGAGSYDPDGSIAAYLWDFGDGQVSWAAKPTHRYGAPGSYTAKLRVTDNKFATGQTTQAVSVTTTSSTNQPPIAKIGVSPLSGTTATSFQFNAAGSYDPDGSVAGYAWDFGDGQTSSQVNPTHRYAAASTYTARLRITDNMGATSQTSRSVSVATATSTNQPPVAVVGVSPASGTTATSFQFNGAGSYDPDGSIAGYLWQFGDGQVSWAANPTHRYAAAGVYTAILRVSDSKGAANQTGLTLTVLP